MSHSYVVDRLMGEFAAASVTLAKGIDEEVGIEDLEADDRPQVQSSGSALKKSSRILTLR